MNQGWQGSLSSVEGSLRVAIGGFLIVCLAGAAMGVAYVAWNTALEPQGVSEHFRGNDDEPNPADNAPLKYPYSAAQLMETTHNHFLGIGLLLVVLGAIFSCSSAPERWKSWSRQLLDRRSA